MMHLYFGTGVLSLPKAALDELGSANLTELRALLAVADDPTLADAPADLAEKIGCREKEARAALEHWKATGILTSDDAPAEKPAKARAHRTRADEFPLYTSSELSDLLERRESVRSLIDEASNILCKFLTPGDMNILVGMVDYLGLDEEAVLLLLAHCRRIGKTNLRSIEKYAVTLADKGLTDATSMEEEFIREEALHSFEGEIRTLFGLKSRSLTSKEARFLENWVSFGYNIDVVRRAYEITVNATGDASLPYANAILETWHAAGLRTPEEIDAKIADDAEKKAGRRDDELGNSYDTDEFFRAALDRSMKRMKKGD